MKNWMMIIVSGLLVCFIAKLWREKQSAMGASYLPIRAFLAALAARLKNRTGKRDDRLARLEEVLRAAELTNNSFFRSLEMVQKNLEAVIVRAENAEQRLHTLLTQTDLGKTDQYSSAALLLSEGKNPEHVARMLNLPLHQVQLVQQLRQAVRQEPKPMSLKTPSARRGQKRAEEPLVAKKQPPVAKRENGAAHREKNAATVR
ncbi:MAG TPA: hypothetical protein VL754_08875 [Verrucomicrobiae bacterium]|jgi:hypothetical protein|nr:hypothetical protein [Verrucomicrobiae bacterium]